MSVLTRPVPHPVPRPAGPTYATAGHGYTFGARPRLSLDKDGDASGDGGNTGTGKDNGGGSGRKAMTEDEIEAEVQRRSARGGAEKALALAVAENDRLRRQNERRVEVPDGGRLLTKEQAADFDAYTALGKKPADLTKALADGEAAAGRVTQFERRAAIAKTAGEHGWRAEAVADLADEFGFNVETREVKERNAKGETIKRETLFAVPAGAADKAEELETFLKAKFRAAPAALDAFRLSDAERRALAGGKAGGDAPRARPADRTARTGPPTFTRQEPTDDTTPDRAEPASAVARVLGSLGMTPSERRAAAGKR